jgi:hypothetical protein
VFRDVLVRRSAATRPMAYPVLWTETTQDVLARGPVARFANLAWDGTGTIGRIRVSYAGENGDTQCGVDGDGTIVQAGAHRRLTRDGELVDLPA